MNVIMLEYLCKKFLLLLIMLYKYILVFKYKCSSNRKSFNNLLFVEQTMLSILMWTICVHFCKRKVLLIMLYLLRIQLFLVPQPQVWVKRTRFEEKDCDINNQWPFLSIKENSQKVADPFKEPILCFIALLTIHNLPTKYETRIEKTRMSFLKLMMYFDWDSAVFHEGNTLKSHNTTFISKAVNQFHSIEKVN